MFFPSGTRTMDRKHARIKNFLGVKFGGWTLDFPRYFFFLDSILYSMRLNINVFKCRYKSRKDITLKASGNDLVYYRLSQLGKSNSKLC